MSTYKIGVLQQALDESVPAIELEAANKQYNELTAKYRDIIQRENSLVARSATVDNLEVGCFENKFTMLLCWFFFYRHFNSSFEVILYGFHNHIKLLFPSSWSSSSSIPMIVLFYFSIFSCNSHYVFLEIAYTLRNNSVFGQADIKALQEVEAELKKEMTSLKERNHSLEQMVNELLSKGN